MSESIEALDLAALLCSRVCHDLISPVGAIVNGLEVLEEEKDEETKAFALDLIKKSAGTASAKLQFCRIAFGAAGSAGAQIDLGDAENISRGFLEDEKTKSSQSAARAVAEKPGEVAAQHARDCRTGDPAWRQDRRRPGRDGRQHGFKVTASGTNAKVPPAVPPLLTGEGGEGLDAHRIQPFYAGLLAKACGLTATATMDGETVVITAE